MLKSFSQFVNEEREGIFKGDLRVGASRAFINRSKDKIAYRVLEFIYKSGEKGRSYTDIVKFIVSLKGKEYNWKEDRGYWATNLLVYGGGRRPYGFQSERSGGGLLQTYCDKVGKNYVLKSWAKKFFDLEEFEGMDLSDESIDFLSKLGEFE